MIDCIAALEDYWNLSSGGTHVSEGPTYPADVPSARLTLTCPSEAYFAGNPAGFNAEDYVWSDEDTLTVEVYSGGTLVSTDVVAFDGVSIVGQPLFCQCAGSRIGVGLEGGVTGTLDVVFKRNGIAVKTETVGFTGFHVPQYFTRPAGIGAWQLKIDGSVAEAEYWDGSVWQDFPAGGLTAAFAGTPVRVKSEPVFPALACWSNNGSDGDPFLYLT